VEGAYDDLWEGDIAAVSKTVKSKQSLLIQSQLLESSKRSIRQQNCKQSAM
jgi:hypothetical protein